MSQHDLTIANQGFPAFRADLNDALQALGSCQSGTSAPSPTFANQLWYDTTNNILKIRNEDNDAWISIATLDQTNDVLSVITLNTINEGTSGSGVTVDGVLLKDNAVTASADSTISGITVGKGTSGVALNTAIGYRALYNNTTGNVNTAFGYGSLLNNTTGNYNLAFGVNAGAGAVAGLTGAGNLSVGNGTGYALTSGNNNTFVGGGDSGSYAATGGVNTTGAFNTFIGGATGAANTTGNYNTTLGFFALNSNTTANYNTAIGYQAGYNNTTGANNTYIGYNAGNSKTTGNGNLFVGNEAGKLATTGALNTFVGGSDAGYFVTTGTKNTILGCFSGNQGGLNITTANNHIVLSDGDGNPRGYCSNTDWYFGNGGTGNAHTGGFLNLNDSTAAGYQAGIRGSGNGTTYWYVVTKGAIDNSSSTFLQCMNTGGGVYLNGASATSWTSASDERVKENLEPITDAANKVSTLRTVVGNYTWDEEKVRRPFLIAQDLQKVLPEAVTSTPTKDGGEELGIAYTEVIPLLVAAIKELKAEVDTLKTQLVSK